MKHRARIAAGVVVGLAALALIASRASAPEGATSPAAAAPTSGSPALPNVGETPSATARAEPPAAPSEGARQAAPAATAPPNGSTPSTARAPNADDQEPPAGAEVALPSAGALDATVHVPNREGIRDAMREQIPRLQFCFEWQLARHPELQGRVEVAFVIGEDGAARDATIVGETIGDETVLQCMRSAIGRMRFDASGDGLPMTVHYPLTFAAEDPDTQRGI